MFSIFVTIDIKPEFAAEFAEASLGDARGSVRDEPGCFRFDINRDSENPHRFYLYEVYQDQQAFEAHLETPHFKQWISQVKQMFAEEPKRIDMQTVFPSAEGWQAQKPALLKW